LTLLLLTFAMNFVARGVPETFAVFLLPVQKGLGISRSQITVTYSLYMLTYGLFGPIAGLIIDRLGARAAYAFGLSCLGIGYLLAGFSRELWQYLLAVGRFGGIGAASLGMIVASALLSRWFTRRIGAIMSLPYAAIGAGMLVLPPLAQVLLSLYDWRIAHRLIGGGVLAILPLVMLLPLGRMTAGSNAWRLRHAATTSGTLRRGPSRRRCEPAPSGACLPPISALRWRPTASSPIASPTSLSTGLMRSSQRAHSDWPACCRRLASSPSDGFPIASGEGRQPPSLISLR
jgi:MFS family permease